MKLRPTPNRPERIPKRRAVEALGIEAKAERSFDFLRIMRTMNELFEKHAPHITKTHLGPETVFLLRNLLPRQTFERFLEHAQDKYDPSEAYERLPEEKTLSFLLQNLSRIHTYSPSFPIDHTFLEKISSEESLDDLNNWLTNGSDKSLTLAAEICFLAPQVIDQVKRLVQANRENFLKRLGVEFGELTPIAMVWLYILDEGARPILKSYIQEHWAEWEAYLQRTLDHTYLEQKTISLAPSELQSALAVALAMEVLTADTADFTATGGLEIQHNTRNLPATPALPERPMA